MRGRLSQITPFVPCTRLADQVAFYGQVLGFRVGFEGHNYAFMTRDAVAVRLVEVSAHVDLRHPERQNSFYIDVVGIDAVYSGMQTALEALEPGRVLAPFNQDYGQREFHVADEDCTLVFFGEAITQS